MESVNQQNNSNKQIENLNLLKKESHKKHKGDLGLNVPKDYFSKSKKEILENIHSSNRGKLIIFSRRNLGWSMAAAVALLITFNAIKTSEVPTVDEIDAVVSDTLNQYKNSHLALDNIDQEQDDILVSSLFVDESDIDDYIDSYVLDELMEDDIQ